MSFVQWPRGFRFSPLTLWGLEAQKPTYSNLLGQARLEMTISWCMGTKQMGGE